MQVNSASPIPKEADRDLRSAAIVSPGAAAETEFLDCLDSAESLKKVGKSITQVHDNVYRMDNSDESPNRSSAQKEERRAGETTLPPPLPPILNPLAGALTPSLVNAQVSGGKGGLSASTSVILIDAISHIRSLGAAYQTVQFNSPDHNVVIRVSSVGDSIKVSMATPDDSLHRDLDVNRASIAAILKRELQVANVELILDPPSNGHSSSGGNSGQQQPQEHQDHEEAES